MKQILHIFAKDARHLWLEILISVGLTAALAATSPHFWSRGATSYDPAGMLGHFSVSDSWLPGLLVVLVPLSWWILVSPLIHEERLVGDRQFWITRPYEWKRLLAAKMLFIAAFLYSPLFLAQCLVVVRAGFNPLSYLPGILYDLFLITCAIILPLIALATVTRNFARMTLAILSVVICLALISWLASAFPAARIPTPLGDSLSLFLVICGCVCVVVLQYAARKTRNSWSTLAITLGVVAALACAAPDQALMGRRYPAEQAPGVVLANANDPGGGAIVSVARGPHDVVINVPMRVSGIPSRSMMITEALRVTIESPDGSHWTSFWQPTYDRFLADKLLPGERIARAAFTMPRSLYEKLKPVPLHVHITLAFVRAREGETTTVSLPLDDFQVPGFGICTPQTGFFYKPYEIGGIVCRAALRQPSLTFVRVNWSYDDCHVPTEERGNVDGEAWVGSLARPPAEFAIEPIWSDGIGFTNQDPGYRSNEPRHICPGTPATFTSYQADGRTQAAFDISGFVLPELSQGQIRVITTP